MLKLNVDKYINQQILILNITYIGFFSLILADRYSHHRCSWFHRCVITTRVCECLILILIVIKRKATQIAPTVTSPSLRHVLKSFCCEIAIVSVYLLELSNKFLYLHSESISFYFVLLRYFSNQQHILQLKCFA